jgi:hypothetical protein
MARRRPEGRNPDIADSIVAGASLSQGQRVPVRLSWRRIDRSKGNWGKQDVTHPQARICIYRAVRDFGILINGVLDLMTRVLANLPHLAIGGFAAYAGFVLSKRHGEAA